MLRQVVTLCVLAVNGAAEAQADRQDFLYALADRESSRNYRIENPFGYLGYFQMGELAMIDAGFYMRDNTPRNDWRGGFTQRSHFVGVRSKQDFLSQPGSQELAVRAFHDKLWQYIVGLGLDRSIGAVVSGIRMTRSGMTAGAHLVGVEGLRQFISSDGGVDLPDGNGTRISEYLRHFAPYY